MTYLIQFKNIEMRFLVTSLLKFGELLRFIDSLFWRYPMLLLKVKYFHIQLWYLRLSLIINLLHFAYFLSHRYQLLLVFIYILPQLFLPDLLSITFLCALLNLINCECEQRAIKHYELYPILDAFIECWLAIKGFNVEF